MSLRFRLIVAFFLLSVVPLAAVTFYTYSTNLEAVREAAGNEATLLAGELSQRMQVVTAQLSQRVERLMTMSNDAQSSPTATRHTAATLTRTATAATAAPAGGAPTASAGSSVASPAAQAARSATTAGANASMATGDVTNALGELAMLINNVEIRGPRGGGRGRGGPGGGGGGRGRGGPGGQQGLGPPQAGSTGASPSGTPGATPQATSVATGPTVASASPTTVPGGAAFAPAVAPAFRGDSAGGPPPNRFGGGQGGVSDGTGRGGGRGDGQFGQGGGGGGDFRRGGPPGPPPPEDADPTRIRIDMAPVWRELVQQMVPDGNPENLSPEERQRVFAEVNQRMLGIQQGIQILRERVAERVADVQQQTAAATGAAPTTQAAASATRAAPAAPRVAAPRPPAAPTAPVVPAAPAAPTASRRTTNITDGRLAVSVEQNGEVISQASAEINVPNLLATVFTTTRRERGEVPFAVAKDGRIETQNDDDRRVVQAIGTTELRADTPPGTNVRPGWIIATTADPTGLQAKFGVARPLGEAVADLRRTMALNVGFGVGLIALALAGIVPISSRLTRNLENLSRGVERISQGDYGARVAVRSNDEVGQLAVAFNKMAADVEKHQRSMVEQERLRRELELGRQIQHDMLPQAPLWLGLTEVKGVSVPAREVGGDFFNYFQLGNGTLALLVGDVSGKGVGAALLMANLQASLRTRLSLGQDLAALARELDRDIEASTPGPVYATLFVGIFDPATRVLRCVNAGHNPQYVIRKTGDLESMVASGLPIGLLAGRGYTEQRVQLDTGDLLFFYTDGCVEATNTIGDEFGMERLESALQAAVRADDVLASVEAEVTKFRAGVELSDDATMMVVRVG